MIEKRAPVGIEVVQRPARQSVSVDADLESRRPGTPALNSMMGESVPCHRIGRPASACVELAFVAVSSLAGAARILCEGIPSHIEAIEEQRRPESLEPAMSPVKSS